ncbi:hypothetical protein N7491_007051 [Penicillium cf. griseofulvum]|uniref:Uncharacterized protein n=1 Tax=Penicillium cf. griseofulvum TaxID=2972120 RepID=A0A9W9M125_9EURO|nr:hypothetical protein N7472_009918 [Penicillium cf. griseofulvum]KAJ5430035.1 hypothetical protein N7491_007051 [Penicillium cf. griseofulvum]KAJ5436191.1 hypothetical protein N7445_007076 [Penicillium cf. griseofulvum]
MFVSGIGDPAAAFEGEPIFLNPTPVTETLAPPQFGFGYFGPPSVGTVSYGPFLCRPPQVYPVSFDPYPPVPPSYGPPIVYPSLPGPQFFVSAPLNTACPNYGPFTAFFPGEPSDIPDSKSHDCLVTYRKYMNWLHTVYYSSNSPNAFVQAWKQALKEMKEAFGRPDIPTVYLLNQFLAAVSANPNTIPWVESLQFGKGSLPASILDEAFDDFLEFEAYRLGSQQSTLGSLDTAVANLKQIEDFPKQYCPFHQRLTRHPVEECYRNPENSKSKRKWRRKQARMAVALEAEKEKLRESQMN